MAFNWGGGASGAASGASAGAMFGPIGMGIGAIGGGLLGGLGGKKGGSAPPPPMALNPSFGILQNLFGVRMGQHKHGDDAGQWYMARDKKNPGLFRGPEFQQSIRDYMFNSPGLTQGEQGLFDQLTGGDYAQNLMGQTTGGLNDLLNMGSGYQSGWRTNAQPIYQEANRNFQANMLPSIAEMIGPQVGLRSQSFIDAAAREGANLMGQAALKDVDLQESAAGRIPMAAQLLQTRSALPFAFANDLMGIGQNYRNLKDSIATRPLQVFNQLSGMGSPGQQGFLQQGFNPQGSGQANLMSSMSSGLGGLADILRSLPGGSPGGAGGMSFGGFGF
jgi:hypothetical protein